MHLHRLPANRIGSALAVICALFFVSRTALAEEISAARGELDTTFAVKLDELAGWCQQKQLAHESELTRAWRIQRDPLKVYAFELPATLDTPADLSGDRAEWWQRFRELRVAQADALFQLARRAIDAHQPRAAYELVVQTVRENPDHAGGRAILGYQKEGDVWLTSFEAARAKAGQVWHDKFGWLSKAQVARYEQGQRYYNGRWIDVEEDARVHRDIRNGWRIETEHYALTTDVSLEEGVKLSRRLERLYGVWQQVFPTYAMSETELANLFKNPTGPRRSRKQHSVVYFRNREEYDQWFVVEPHIAMTLGIYRFDKKGAFFFAGEGEETNVIEHEATHQLFWETRPVAPDVGAKNNFWAVEAVAVYMESLTAGDGYLTLGGLRAGRVPAAYQGLVKDDFYVPLAELTAMGMKTLQRDSPLQKIYSESAGLAWFQMSGRNGAYRDLFTTYLQAIYTGRADPETLAKLTGKNYPALDDEYREFMKAAGRRTVEF